MLSSLCDGASAGLGQSAELRLGLSPQPESHVTVLCLSFCCVRWSQGVKDLGIVFSIWASELSVFISDFAGDLWDCVLSTWSYREVRL